MPTIPFCFRSLVGGTEVIRVNERLKIREKSLKECQSYLLMFDGGKERGKSTNLLILSNRLSLNWVKGLVVVELVTIFVYA